MTDLVIDASAALAWLFGEEQAAEVRARIGDATLVAPSVWRVEVVNAMLIRERRKDITPAQGTRFLRVLDALAVEIVAEPIGRSLEQLALFARPHQLTAYDAVYLELATSLGLPLWTYDRNLRQAAERIGAALFEESDA